jgi:hypothetical protein
MINLTLHAAAMPANSRSQQKSSSLMRILYIIFLPASCCVTNIMMYPRGFLSRDDFFFLMLIFLKKVPTFCTCADSSFNFLFLREKKLSILAFFFEATNLLNASSNPHLERP